MDEEGSKDKGQGKASPKKLPPAKKKHGTKPATQMPGGAATPGPVKPSFTGGKAKDRSGSY